MLERKNALIISGLALFAMLILAPVMVQAIHTKPDVDLPVLGAAPVFSLTGQDAQPFSRETLDGNVWVADFIFTTCAGPCPTMSSRMAELQRRFAGEKELRFTTVTVNPEQDTPEVLTKYAERFHADTKQWHFLTGGRDAIHRLAVEGFHVGSVEEPVFHSTHFILVDRDGRIRGYFDGLDEAEVHRLGDAIAALL